MRQPDHGAVKILTFTSLFPNSRQPRHGIFIETRLRHLCAAHPVRARVVAPVPWYPRWAPDLGGYGKYARIPLREQRADLEVAHPRYPVIPKLGMSVAPWLLARWSLPRLQALQRDFDFDLLDAHYFYPDGVAAALLARWLRKPLAITARGSDINVLPDFAAPRAQIRWAMRKADACIAVSEALKTRVAELEPRHQRLVKLRNGVDLELFRPPEDREALRSRLGISGTTLLSVGNLIELKGHHLVIDALRQLPGVRLIIIGDGAWKSRLQERARSNAVDERVQLLGVVEQQRLREYYGAADALVLASSREGWANVLLESMACGTPVVATPVFGTPEVVSSPAAGVLTDTRSAAALARACTELLARPPKRSATRRYAESFSWRETSDGLFTLFSEVLGAPRHR